MRTVVLYAYPPEPDGLSLQGDMLYRGMRENGEEVMPCHWKGGLQKTWLYRYFKPDVAIGIGYWGYAPDIIMDPQKFGVTPVPWLVADGWVANYQELLSGLPLVFVTSKWVKDTYKRDGVSTKNFEVVPIGVEPDVFRPIPKSDPSVKALREMFGVEDEEKLILTIGGDVTSKGAQEVFRALAKIDRDFPSWKYVCKSWESPGARAHRKDEIALIEELGLDRKKIVFFEGSLSHDFMPYLLSAADIYAAPSRLDGYGMIQVEAQACGVPVISIDAMGPKETIVHGETGFLARVAETIDLESELVHPHMGFSQEERIFFDKPKTFAYRANIDDLAEHLLILLSDDRRRKKMGENARKHAVKNFHYRDITTGMAAQIRERLQLK